jgi:hypothetical protein
MPPRRPARLLLALALGLAFPLPVLLWLLRTPPPPPAPTTVFAEPAPPAPPTLRPRRVATPEAPLLAHEELLTLEGDAAADLSALADLTRAYLERPADPTRPPLGFNEDLARALTDPDALGESAIPPDHPALRDGQLIDRWGTPWHVHPLASDVIELRSAGPDLRLYTSDDLVSSR